MRHCSALLKAAILSLIFSFFFVSSTTALDSPPECKTDQNAACHNAYCWGGWATARIDKKTINRGDIVKLRVDIIGGPPADTFCSYSNWGKLGTSSVRVNFPAASCFELIDYSPGGDSFHNVIPGTSSVLWTALTPDPAPPHWLNDHCLCTTWRGGQWSDLTNCPADLWPSGHYSVGDSFTVTLKAICDRVDTGWSISDVAVLSGSWGVSCYGEPNIAQDYFKFGGSTAISLEASPNELPADGSTVQVTARVSEKDSGVAMPGQMVNFSISAGGGMIHPVSAITAGDGTAVASIDSGGIAGTVTITASVPDDSAETVVTFTEHQPEPNDPRNNKGYDDNTSYTGEPVHPGTGNLYFSQRLFGFPGLLLPVRFDVSYNSVDKDRNGPIGYGWSHAFDIALAEANGEIAIKWADGKEDFFQDDGTQTGTYKPVRSKTRVKLKKLSTGEYEAILPEQIFYSFNSSGQLIKISDPNGNHVDLEYSSRLTRVIDTAGRNIEFAWSDDRIISITTPIKTGDTVSFDYDSSGNLTAITNPRGNDLTFTYDDAHQMLTQTDFNGNTVTTNTYDASGRVVKQVDALGGIYTMAYSEESDGMLTAITSPQGDTVHHYYDRAMNTVKIVDGKGGENTAGYRADGLKTARINKNGTGKFQGYDAVGNPVTMQDETGATTTALFNTLNLPTKIVDPQGGTTTLAYDEKGNMTKIVDPLKRTWKRTYDSRGLPVTITDPRAKTWTLVWNSAGLRESSTDPAGNKTLYSYDAAGNLTGITLPDGNSYNMTYDAGGLPLSHTDPMGYVTRYSYDKNGNVISKVFEPTGAETLFSCNAANRLIMLTTPSGGEISLTHNGYQQLASISDSDGITTHFAQDELDRPVSATAPDGYATRFSYDSAGNLLSVVNPQDAVRSYAYDPAGRLKQITDPLGGISSYAYDKAGRLASIRNQLSHDINFAYDSAGQMVEITLPDDRRYQYQYDPLGNVRKIIDPMQHAWKFSYNDINTLQSIVNPAGESETMAYDSRGRISKRTLRTNEEINYAYDKNGLLTSLSLPESRTIQMSYRSDGLMEALSDSSAAASVTMLYDLEGRRISYADPNGKTMGFTYTPGGRISKIIYPNSHELLHAYDTSGRLQSLTDWLGNVTTFTYDSVDQLTGISLPNGTTSRFVYDSAGELNGIRHFRSDDSDIFASEYTRDATGRIISISGAAFPAPTPAGDSAVSHVYDENNRLLTTIKDGIVAANTFDARGNVVRRQEGPATTSFTYDALNNLLAVTRGSQATMYGYAGGGVRVSKTFDGNTRHYLNDGITLYCTYSPSGVVENYYIYAGNYLIYSLAENGDILVYHADERGNVAAVTNADQVVVETATYGPYGEELSRTGSLVNPFRFMGQLGVLTDENGLLYIRARYYDPGQRRFVNEDPLGVLREPNLYAYAAGDPINYVDPTGLATQKMKASDGKTYNVPAVDISVLRELAKKYKADKDTAAVNEINAISAKLRDYAAEQQLLYVKALEENNGKEDGAKVTVCTETYNEIKEITTELKLERFKFGEVGISREYKGMGNVGHGHFAATLIDVKDPKNPKTVAVIDPIQPGWGWLGQITQKRVVVYNPTSWALQKSWSVGVPSLLTTLTNTAWEIISPAGGSRSPLGKLNATTYDLKHVDWNLQP